MTQAASTTTPLTYSAWKDAAAKDLLERHGIRTNVREKLWRDMTPAVAADRARADYDAQRARSDCKSGRPRRFRAKH